MKSPTDSDRLRRGTKRWLARTQGSADPRGSTLLIYHRIGAGTVDELDLAASDFLVQMDAVAEHDVISVDAAMDRLEDADSTPGLVLTFDDGFADVYDNAWPVLRDRRLPFTIYLASGYMGRPMRWAGSTAQGEVGLGLQWRQLEEMVASGLCTIGNHTHSHAPPSALSVEELDTCSQVIEHHLGVRPAHFTYPWGIAVPRMEAELRTRFRSSSTGELGRNEPGADPMRLRRVPVRRTDPPAFFRAKLVGSLRAERAYGALVGAAKAPRRLQRRLAGHT